MLFSIENLSAGYGRSEILHEISLVVDAGEIATLIGANGAGKSTMLLAISGLVARTGGRILFEGDEITGAPPHEIVRRGIIHVPEGRRIFPRLSVRENLEMGAYGRGQAAPADFERVFEIFPILAERRNQAGGTLSGGEQQMLAIGRGLMARPRLLLLDEPSLGIAPLLVERIFAALQRIHAEGTPILLVEQNAHLALEMAERAYVLENGRIAIQGAGRELMKNNDVIEAYLGI